MVVWQKILVVDDSVVFREMMKTVMTPVSGTVLTAKDVQEAIAAIEDNPGLDLVLCDVVLPDGDGFDVLEHLHAKAEPKPPAILVTARPEEPAAERARQLGALDYLSKPTTVRAVLRSFQSAGRMPGSRRRTPRKRCVGRAVLLDPAASAPETVSWDIYNLSLDGAFLETKGPLPIDRLLDLKLDLDGRVTVVKARVVRVQHPSWLDVAGSGIRFEDLEPEAEALIREVAQATEERNPPR